MKCLLPLTVVLVAVAGPAVANRDAPCPRAGQTLAQTSQARVWLVKGVSDPQRFKQDRVYGCARATGRTVLLNRGDTEVVRAPGKLKLAGTMVAYETLSFDLKPYAIVVRSLRTGRGVHTATSNAAGSSEGHTGPADRIVLKPNGSVAWTASVDCVCEGTDPGENGWEVHAIGRRGRRAVLDAGREVDADSLRLGARRTAISWLSGGERRTAPLR